MCQKICCLEHDFYLFHIYIYWKCHHPKWRSHIFQRARCQAATRWPCSWTSEDWGVSTTLTKAESRHGPWGQRKDGSEWLYHTNLVGGLEYVCIFPYIGNNRTIWRIFFRGVETTNQLYIIPSVGRCHHTTAGPMGEEPWRSLWKPATVFSSKPASVLHG